MKLEQEIKELRDKIADFGKYIVPTGTVVPFAGSKAPNGWLLCDGAAINRVAYASLFEVVGKTYGSGDGYTTFNLPDLRGRTAIGSGENTRLTSRILGQTLGAENHVLTAEEMPNHAHGGITVNAGNHTHNGTTTNAGNHAHSGTTVNGGNHAHSGTTQTANSKKYRVVDCSGTNSAPNHEKGWASCAEFADRNDTNFTNANHTHDFTTDTVGEHTHRFTTESSGEHQHNFSTDRAGEHGHTIFSEGESQAHNNMQPCLALNYIIKT